MNQSLIFLGIILLVLAFFVGVKKQTWLLSGFNQKRVKDQDKLAKLVGSVNLVMGLMLIGGAFIDHPDTQILIPIVLIANVATLGYVNTKMVE